MSLPIPQVGNEAGPQYATDVNSCLTIVDGHNHSPGYGVAVLPSGLNINSVLTFQNNYATNLLAVRFQPQTIALTGPADLGELYELNNDLFYIDGVGNQVRITQSGAVAGTPGSIANLLPPASASYNSGTQTFIFQSAANTPANIDGGSFVFRDITANSHGITMSAPTALAADYNLTLPSALPGSQKFLSLDAAGNIAASWAVDGTTIQITANTVQIPSNVNLPGNAVKENGSNVIVSNTNATNSLCIIRGYLGGDGHVIGGEGFGTASHPGTGQYTITFTTPFGDAPIVTVTPVGDANILGATGIPTTTSVDIFLYTANTGARVDQQFAFIAIGQRA